MTSKQELIKQVEASSLRETPLEFSVGDTVEVHTRILEGDKERVQVFAGVVISRRGGGTRETFTVRRIVAGEGVERTFPLHSPKIAQLDVKRHGKVRRAKLFYLRERVGKKTRLTERRVQVPGTPSPVEEMSMVATEEPNEATETAEEMSVVATEEANEATETIE